MQGGHGKRFGLVSSTFGLTKLVDASTTASPGRPSPASSRRQMASNGPDGLDALVRLNHSSSACWK